MILAAGLGTRLRPLTQITPKPLLPLANRPLLRHHLELLRTVGVREVMVNVHHLPEAIPRALGDGSQWGMSIRYSIEPQILGTGGGIKAVEAFLRAPGEPFLVLNGDLLIEVDLAAVVTTHRASGSMATMVLREDPEAAKYGALGVDEQGRILDFVGRARAQGEVVRRGLFTGIHVLEPAVLDLLPMGESCINQTAYPRMIREGWPVQAYFQHGFWSDVGTPERYFAANMAILEQRLALPGPSPFAEACWAVAAEGAHGDSRRVAGWAMPAEGAYGDSRRVAGWDGAGWEAPVVVGAEVTAGAGASIGPKVCLGTGVTVGEGAQVRHSVVLPGAKIAPGVRIEGALVWRDGAETRVLDGFGA
jgi:NDP-sugar pyrophosphorylase family protein